ncbi:MAG: hypothetical protein ACKVIH_13095 [Burkholderiales bacterium]
MQTSEKIAIAAHLHVLLRRKTGRVTDTEWMAVNAEYAAAIVRFARTKAEEDGHADLAEWANKLAMAVADPGERPPRPLVQTALAALQAVAPTPTRHSAFAHTDFGAERADSGLGPESLQPAGGGKRDDTSKYVGGLR